MIVIVRKDRRPCVNLMHSIVQRQHFLSIHVRSLKGYLKGNAGEGKYVTFFVRWNFWLVSRSSGAIHFGVPIRTVA
jgi:hypothetical protein